MDRVTFLVPDDPKWDSIERSHMAVSYDRSEIVDRGVDNNREQAHISAVAPARHGRRRVAVRRTPSRRRRAPGVRIRRCRTTCSPPRRPQQPPHRRPQRPPPRRPQRPPRPPAAPSARAQTRCPVRAQASGARAGVGLALTHSRRCRRHRWSRLSSLPPHSTAIPTN